MAPENSAEIFPKSRKNFRIHTDGAINSLVFNGATANLFLPQFSEFAGKFTENFSEKQGKFPNHDKQ
jgi:hypothetical protein